MVIGQNAAKLGTFANYRDTIDAIAQEQIWFEGGPSNNPPEDCPLPGTGADIDTPSSTSHGLPVLTVDYAVQQRI
jgi:hypothetical protein